MTKGYTIKLAFPTNVYDFIQSVAKKLTTLPIRDPNTNQIIPNPETGKPLPMCNTGTVEEVVHQCIIFNILPLVLSHPAFEAERTKIDAFREEYGNYLTSLIQNHVMKQLQSAADAQFPSDPASTPKLKQKTPPSPPAAAATTTSTTTRTTRTRVEHGSKKGL